MTPADGREALKAAFDAALAEECRLRELAASSGHDPEVVRSWLAAIDSTNLASRRLREHLAAEGD